MPLYTVRNTNTNTVEEINMKYEEFCLHMKANPHLKQEFTKFPSTGDSIRMGLKKPSDSFRDVLRNIKSHHDGRTSTINDF